MWCEGTSLSTPANLHKVRCCSHHLSDSIRPRFLIHHRRSHCIEMFQNKTFCTPQDSSSGGCRHNLQGGGFSCHHMTFLILCRMSGHSCLCCQVPICLCCKVVFVLNFSIRTQPANTAGFTLFIVGPLNPNRCCEHKNNKNICARQKYQQSCGGRGDVKAFCEPHFCTNATFKKTPINITRARPNITNEAINKMSSRNSLGPHNEHTRQPRPIWGHGTMGKKHHAMA